MSVTSRLMTWLMKLPPATTPNPRVTRDVPIPMPDGAVLLADLYTPRDELGSGATYPTVLIRTPYGRAGMLGAIFALPFAERGYNVLHQSTRGTAGSGGEFIYARREHDDGLATIAWIAQQPWFNGELAMAGASYLGFAQWAVAAVAGPELKALAPAITSSDFNHFRYQGGTITLESMLSWSTMMSEFAARGQRLSDLLSQGARQRKLDRAYNHLPLKEADRLVIGKPSQSYQNALAHGPEDDYWLPVDYSQSVRDVSAPVGMVSGWYDLFLSWQLLDYRRLREAGKQPYLLIGPWYHGQPSSVGPLARENLAWFDAHLKGKTSALRQDPVRLYVMGANQWRDFADWPPPSRPETWFLQPEGGLAQTPPAVSEPDRYRYNPADPTPAVGGNSLGKYMGQKDNRQLEARLDVMVYTSAPLRRDLEVIGPVHAELYVRSSLEYTDFFARLCVVERSGRSLNLCDGIIRLAPDKTEAMRQEDGALRVPLDLWPTANRFKRGQRIRLQVSSGAHPRFARNPGSGERIGEETTLKLAEQAVYHDPQHPSSLTLPVTSGE